MTGSLKILKLPIHQISHSVRARNSVKANGVAFIISNLVAYLINIYWVFVPGQPIRAGFGADYFWVASSRMAASVGEKS